LEKTVILFPGWPFDIPCEHIWR